MTIDVDFVMEYLASPMLDYDVNHHDGIKFVRWALWSRPGEDRVAAARRLHDISRDDAEALVAQYVLEKGIGHDS